MNPFNLAREHGAAAAAFGRPRKLAFEDSRAGVILSDAKDLKSGKPRSFDVFTAQDDRLPRRFVSALRADVEDHFARIDLKAEQIE